MINVVGFSVRMSSVWRAIALAVLMLQTLPAYAGSRVTYYVNDAMGSPAAALDETGAVISRSNFLPYGGSPGTVIGGETNEVDRVGFTGHIHDDTGLIYMGARYFDPVAGRFMGMDPVGFDEANPQSFNRYQYANNNPYRYVDPDGGSPEIVWDAFNVGLGVKSLAANLSSGNYVNAAVDSVGILVDVMATIAPAIPGGAGVAISASRGSDVATLSRLPDSLAGTFAGGRYTSRVLEKDAILYRSGVSGKPLGQFFSKQKPMSVIQTRIDSAVLPNWPGGARSPIDTVFKIKIPAGTTVHAGKIGSQGGHFVGGKQQIVVEKPWLIEGVEVLGSTALK